MIEIARLYCHVFTEPSLLTELAIHDVVVRRGAYNKLKFIDEGIVAPNPQAEDRIGKFAHLVD